MSISYLGESSRRMMCVTERSLGLLKHSPSFAYTISYTMIKVFISQL